MTKIYFDTSCLNRPFDDQAQVRVRLEAEAVLAILARIENGEWTWVGSEILIDEIEQTPDAHKLSRAKLLSGFIQENIEIGEKEEQRARELQMEGFQVFDSLHIACAESAKADVFLSTDDRLLKLAKRISKQLHVRVENPLTWVEEMI
jgi:predicted nucleic acid-binding protein